MDFGSDSAQLSRDGSSVFVSVRNATALLAEIQLGKQAVLMETHSYPLVDFTFVFYACYFQQSKELKASQNQHLHTVH